MSYYCEECEARLDKDRVISGELTCERCDNLRIANGKKRALEEKIRGTPLSQRRERENR